MTTNSLQYTLVTRFTQCFFGYVVCMWVDACRCRLICDADYAVGVRNTKLIAVGFFLAEKIGSHYNNSPMIKKRKKKKKGDLIFT